METLYIKLYEKYSKLKGDKDSALEKVNKDQEVKFLEYVSVAERLIEHLKTENKLLCQNNDELRTELRSLRTVKDQQFDDFQERLMEEKQKNQQLSAEIEQLRNLQREGLCCSNRTNRHEDQRVNNVQHSSPVTGHQSSEKPLIMTRARARLSLTTDPAVNSSSVPGHVELSTGRCLSQNQSSETPTRMTRKRARLSVTTDTAVNGISVPVHSELPTGRGSSADHSRQEASNVHATQPECCWSNSNNGGPCKCLFQCLVECLLGLKVSIVDQPEGRSIRAVHQSSGYTFSLTWIDKAAQGEGEFVYNVSSLGTFVKVAPEWMREVIIFSTSMCPIFFERVTRVIKKC